MAPRRSHTKSRKGCSECKRRKVKCDEGVPACFNCARRGIICSLSGPAAPTGSPYSPLSDSDGRTAPPRSDAGRHLTHIELTQPCSRPRPSIAETWGQGLELMHHYCTVTAGTLALRLDMQHVWRSVIPGMAYASPFLMHGILAVAALHKAHLITAHRRAYADLAVYHQTAGLEGFRAALSELEAGSEDWEPSFCFASMTVLSMCWQPHSPGVPAHDAPPTAAAAEATTPGALDLFVFIKGIRAVLQPYQPRLANTPLSPLAEAGWRQRADASTFESLLRFSLLPGDIFEVLDEATRFYEATLDESTRGGYLDAVDELRRAACMVATAGTQPESRMVMFIPYLIEETVRLDIMASRPHAMVFLAHFALLLRVLETRFWYFSGLAKRLFIVIDKSLSRFPVHLDAVRWQRKHVFESYET